MKSEQLVTNFSTITNNFVVKDHICCSASQQIWFIATRKFSRHKLSH